jgi:hypothetical protein
MNRRSHILSASTGLPGICLAIIGALKLTHQRHKTWPDEVA